MKKKVLLKLSGEALSKGRDAFDRETLLAIASQIKYLRDVLNLEVFIVIGGGNILRGHLSSKIGLGEDRSLADYMGMQATIINAFALRKVLETIEVKSVIFNALDFEFISSTLDKKKTLREVGDGKVIIFAGGTGKPGVTTDTTTILRAIEYDVDTILIAKNNVDGVYSSDPNKNSDAEFIPEITIKRFLKDDIKIIDREAIELLEKTKSNIEVIFFNINTKNNIINVFKNPNLKRTILKK